MLRVAVLGLGNIGKTHANAYNVSPDAELVALCDLDADRVDPVAHQYGVKAYHDLDQLLQSEQIDAISICTAGPENGGHHFEPTLKCLDAGKHVLVEKPISNDIEEARTMVRHAKERGLLLGVNLNHRFTPAAERAKRLQEEGALGEVLFINMSLRINNPNDSSPWFHMRALHPHSIDVMRYFGGPIAKVQAFMHKGPGRAIWSNASVNVEVAGDKGRFVIENVYERLEVFPRDSPEKLVIDNPIMGGVSSFNETFHNRINRFVEQVQAGGPLDASGDDGLAAQEVIEAAIRSWEHGTIEDVAG
jgi:predicted dehydrogenase